MDADFDKKNIEIIFENTKLLNNKVSFGGIIFLKIKNLETSVNITISNMTIRSIKAVNKGGAFYLNLTELSLRFPIERIKEKIKIKLLIKGYFYYKDVKAPQGNYFFIEAKGGFYDIKSLKRIFDYPTGFRVLKNTFGISIANLEVLVPERKKINLEYSDNFSKKVFNNLIMDPLESPFCLYPSDYLNQTIIYQSESELNASFSSGMTIPRFFFNNN